MFVCVLRTGERTSMPQRIFDLFNLRIAGAEKNRKAHPELHLPCDMPAAIKNDSLSEPLINADSVSRLTWKYLTKSSWHPM